MKKLISIIMIMLMSVLFVSCDYFSHEEPVEVDINEMTLTFIDKEEMLVSNWDGDVNALRYHFQLYMGNNCGYMTDAGLRTDIEGFNENIKNQIIYMKTNYIEIASDGEHIDVLVPFEIYDIYVMVSFENEADSEDFLLTLKLIAYYDILEWYERVSD